MPGRSPATGRRSSRCSFREAELPRVRRTDACAHAAWRSTSFFGILRELLKAAGKAHRVHQRTSSRRSWRLLTGSTVHAPRQDGCRRSAPAEVDAGAAGRAHGGTPRGSRRGQGRSWIPSDVVLSVDEPHSWLDDREPNEPSDGDLAPRPKSGEIVGIAGVQGNGQTELVEIAHRACGHRSASGRDGRSMREDVTSEPRHGASTRSGVAHVSPEDRQRQRARAALHR